MIAASLQVQGKGRGEYEMLLEGFINVQSCLINQWLYLFINLTATSLFSIPLFVDNTSTSSFQRMEH